MSAEILRNCLNSNKCASFLWIPRSHVGRKYNDVVDVLAKKAIEDGRGIKDIIPTSIRSKSLPKEKTSISKE